jgi:hypothetical protein
MTAPTGPLPNEYRDRLDWTRLPSLLDDAILAQPPDVRNAIIAHVGPADVRMQPFDAEGYATVTVQGQPLARIHWTRFMPEAGWAPPEGW